MINTAFRIAIAGCGAVERRLSIVLFHRVLDQIDPMLDGVPDVDRFAEQMAWLRDTFNILPLRDATRALFERRLPARALCVTFDDGYRDNLVNALPVLERMGIPATFYVTTRFRAGGMMWNDRVIEAVRAWRGDEIDLQNHDLGCHPIGEQRCETAGSLLDRLKYRRFAVREQIADELLESSGARVDRMMMNDEEIGKLHRAGMEIGGHTVSHPILQELSDQQARHEIERNKQDLETIIGEPVVSFAYPNGRPRQDYGGRHVMILRDLGYRYALSTAYGTATHATDRWQLPRFTPWDANKGKYLARMVSNYFRDAEHVSEVRGNTALA